MPVSRNVWIAAGISGGLFVGWLILRRRTTSKPSAVSPGGAPSVIPGAPYILPEDNIRHIAGDEYVIVASGKLEGLAHQLNKLISTLLAKCNGTTCGDVEKSWVSAILYAYVCGKGDPILVTADGYHTTLGELVDRFPITYNQLDYDWKNALIKIGDLIGYPIGFVQRISPYGNIWISDICPTATIKPLEKNEYIQWATAAGFAALGVPLL